MAKLIINDWTGGLAPKWWQDDTQNKAGTDNQFLKGIINLRVKPGCLSPGNGSATAAINNDQLTDNARIVRFAPFDDEYITSSFTTFYFGQGAKVHAFAAGTISNSAPFPHTINATSGTHNGHTGETVLDLIVYERNNLPFLFYAYKDATDADLGYFGNLLSSPAFLATEDAFSGATGGAVLDKDFDIVLEVADNGFMYVGNGNAIHKFDGTGASDAVTQSVIDLGTPWQIIDMRDGRGYMWIAATNFAAGGLSLTSDLVTYRPNAVYVWNKVSSTLSFDDVIPVPGCSKMHSLFFDRGLPTLITTGHNGVVEIRRYTGSEFKVIQEVVGAGVSSFSKDGVPANRHAVLPINNGFVWQDINTNWWFYGEIIPGSGDGLFKISLISSISNSEGGAIAHYNNEQFLTAYYDGTDENVKIFKPFGNGTCVTGANYFSKVYELPKLSKLKSLTVFYPPFTGSSSAGNMTIYIHKNMATTNLPSSGLTVSVDSDDNDDNRGWKYFPLGTADYMNVNSVQVEINWAARSNFQQCTPYRIEIEYEPQTKKK